MKICLSIESFRSPQRRIHYLVLLLFSFGVMSCIEPFSPPETNDPGGYLVVDGFLNIGEDSSIIALTHTQNTNETAPVGKESGAEIKVESENGEFFDFEEVEPGVYKLAPRPFNPSLKYRLHIKRISGNEYASDFVTVSRTPPIDSITYRFDVGRNAMIVYVNAHDEADESRFFRWKFEETFQYRAAYYSGLQRDPVTRELIARNEDINLCWKTLESKDIKLGSTVKLSQNVIRDVPVNVIGTETNKLFFGYSILVKQYGLSREAFEYWTDLAKTTQGTGSLFDPLPSQVTGNVKNRNDNKELVFGYFSAAVEQKQRIFIKKDWEGTRVVCLLTH